MQKRNDVKEIISLFLPNILTQPQNISSVEDSLDSYESSDESDTAVHQLYQKALSAVKKQKSVLKAPYTGDSHATKFRRQSYWKKASSGCRQIAGFFQVSPIIEFQEDHRVIHK